MSNVAYWLSLTPVVAPLLAAALIPVACKMGSVVQRALYLYDAQPTARSSSISNSTQDTRANRKSALLRIAAFTLAVVAFLALIFPPPLSWRSTLAFNLINHVRVLVPTLVLILYTLPVPRAVIALALHRSNNKKQQDLLLSRRPTGHAQVTLARPRTPLRLENACAIAVATGLALWLLPAPSKYWSFEPLEMPHIPDHKLLIIHYLSLAFGFVSVFGALTQSTAIIGPGGTSRASLLRLNFLSLFLWAFTIALTALLSFLCSSEASEAPKQGSSSDDGSLPADGILETVNFIVNSAIQPLAIILVVPLFAFLYRYEEADDRLRTGITDDFGISLASSQHVYADEAPSANDAQKLLPVADDAPRSVSIRRAALLAPGLRICQSRIARSVFVLFVGIQLATFGLARQWLSRSGLYLWSHTEAQMSVLNPLPLLCVPFLSLFALVLARNNDASLWRYREDWAPPKVGSSNIDFEDHSVTAAPEAVPSQEEKEEDHLLVNVE